MFDSGGVRVTAIPVLHGTWREAFGYGIDTPDRSIVISGDTRPASSIERAAAGVDMLIHEVHPASAVAPPNQSAADWGRCLREFHTSDIELGELVATAKPKMLVLYHFGAHGVADAEVIADIRAYKFSDATHLERPTNR